MLYETENLPHIAISEMLIVIVNNKDTPSLIVLKIKDVKNTFHSIDTTGDN